MTGQSPGSARVLNAVRPLFIGGLISAERTVVVARGLNPHSFGGCVDSLTINNQLVDLTLNISSLNVVPCGSELDFHAFPDPVPNGVCAGYLSTANPAVYPSPSSTCVPTSDTDSGAWIYANDGYYACRTWGKVLSGCAQYLD